MFGLLARFIGLYGFHSVKRQETAAGYCKACAGSDVDWVIRYSEGGWLCHGERKEKRALVGSTKAKMRRGQG